MDYSKVKGIYVYLELHSTRLLVGHLQGKGSAYQFSYHKKYLDHKKAIPLGKEFPLTQQHFASTTIFLSFLDRIPSKENPAYNAYCKGFNINPEERNVFVLLATIGSKGPSSFVFVPEWSDSFDGKTLKRFRKSLKVTTREFAARFGFSHSSIVRIENGKTSGTEILRILEILHRFPETQGYYVHQNHTKSQIKSDKWLQGPRGRSLHEVNEDPEVPQQPFGSFKNGTWYHTFASKDIKAFRRDLGISIENFSYAFSVSSSTIMSAEKGRSISPNICRFLDVMRHFPEVSCYYIERHGGRLHSKIKNKILKKLHEKYTV